VLEADGASGAGTGSALVTMEEKAGLVRAAVRSASDDSGGTDGGENADDAASEASYAEFEAPKLPERVIAQLPVARVAQALGLDADMIGFGNHGACVWSAGVPFTFVPVANRQVLRHARLPGGVWDDLLGRETGAPFSVLVYCPAEGSSDASFEARMFAPDDGMIEDPATGSAAAAFAGLFAATEKPADGTHRLVISQGVDMCRASRIHLELEVAEGAVNRIRIAGHAVPVACGTLAV